MADAIGTAFIDVELDGSKFTAGLKGLGDSAVTTGRQVGAAIGSGVNPVLDTLTEKFKRLAYYAAAAFSVHKIIEFAKESAMLATRVETLNISLYAIAKNAGYTTQEIDKFVIAVKAKGITTVEATESIIKLAQANIDLVYAEKLARVAQDAAVVGNINSSAAFARMIHGIRTQQTEVLRGIGINIRMDQAFDKLAKTLNKTAINLNQTERAQAIVNAVFEEGAKLTGIYEAAMTTAGKQMNSTKRYVDEIKESLGAAFGPAMTVIVMAFNNQLKELGHWLTLPGSKEKIFEIALEIKNMAAAVWDAGMVVVSAAKVVFAILSKLENVIKGVAYAVGVYLVANILMAIKAFFAGEVAATGFLATLKRLQLFLTRSPVGVLLTVLSLAATAFFTLKENANEAADALALFGERSKSFSLDEATKQAEILRQNIEKTKEEIRKATPSAGMLDITHQYRLVEKLKEKLKLYEDELGYVKARITATKNLNELEEKAAKVVKDEKERKLREEEEAKGRKKKEAQLNESVIADMKRSDDLYFANRKTLFDMDIAKSKAAGESEVSIYNRSKEEKLALAAEEYFRTLAVAKKTIEQKAALDKQGFDAQLALDQARLDAEAKLAKSEMEIKLGTVQFNISNTEKELQAAAAYYSGINEYSKESYDMQILLIKKKADALTAGLDKQKFIDFETAKLDERLLKTKLDAQLGYYETIGGNEAKILELKKKLFKEEAKERALRSQGTLSEEQIYQSLLLKNAQETTGKMGEIFKNAATGIQSSFTTLFEDILDGGVSSFKKLGDSIIAMFKKVLAQMLTLAIARPIMIPVVTRMGSVLGMESAASAVVKDMGGSTGLSAGASAGGGALGAAGMGWSASIETAMSNFQTGAANLSMRATEAFGFGESSAIATGNAIKGLSTSAFAGWTAGVSTFVANILSGKSFKESAIRATATGLGTYAGAALGSYFWPIGTAIGAVVGGWLGNKIGGIFGGAKEHKFSLTELVQSTVNDITFNATKGFEKVGYQHIGGTNTWYEPIANAYSNSIELIQQSFNKMIFDFSSKLPEEMQTQILNELAATDFGIIQAGISGGKWGESKAQEVIGEIAKKYAAALSKTLGDAYATALSDYVLEKGAGGLVGDTAVWEVLVDRVQTNINDMFLGIAETIKGGGFEEGLKAIDEVNAVVGKIGQAMVPISEIIATKDMDDYELSLYNINKQFDAYAKTLKEAGVDLAKYTDLEEARSIVIDKLITQEDQLIENLRGYAGTIGQWLVDLNMSSAAPVSSMQSWVTEYNKRKELATGGGDVAGYLSYAKEYLTYMRAYGGDYKSTYETVVGDVTTLGENFEDIVDTADLQLQATKEADQAAREAAQAQLDATKSIAAAAITAAVIVAEQPADVTSAAASVASYDWSSVDWGVGWGGFASGGLANKPSVFGESGPEWAVPTYEPQRTKFLKSAPKSFWSNLGQGGGEDITIMVPVYLDGNVIAESTAKYVSRNSNLNEAIRRAI